MFGKPVSAHAPPPAPAEPSAADVARIQGGGLTQVIVTDLQPLTFSTFLNDRAVDQMDVESLSIDIEAPDQAGATTVRATLAWSGMTVTGQKAPQRTELFPGTVEVVALGRRISVTCVTADSLDGLWISLGLKADGTGSEVTGARVLRVLLTEGILDAKLTWVDGDTVDLLPQ